MNTGEKIMNLRKDCNYSQEELASILGVSRQSVSKWELGDSLPDLDKIIKLSELFHISTDELLKEDHQLDRSHKTYRVSDEQVRSFLSQREKTMPGFVAAMMLFVLSPVALFVFGGSYSYGFFHQIFHSETQAGTVGLILLLVMVAAGVGLCIYTGRKTSGYEWMESKDFEISLQMKKEVKKLQDDFERNHTALMMGGVALLILSVIPLLGLIAVSEKYSGFGLGLMMAIAAFGVGLLVLATRTNDTYNILLQTADYTKEYKAARARYHWVAGCYWCIVTALYLAVSFIWNCWNTSWLIMCVGGILYGALISWLRHHAASTASAARCAE